MRSAFVKPMDLTGPSANGSVEPMKSVQFGSVLRMVFTVFLANFLLFAANTDSDAVEVPQPNFPDSSYFDLYLDGTNNVESSEIVSYGEEPNFGAVQGYNDKHNLSNWNYGTYRTFYKPEDYRVDGTVHSPFFNATHYAAAGYSQYKYNVHVPSMGSDSGRTGAQKNHSNPHFNAWKLCECTWGTWYANWYRFRFEPDAAKIKALNPGDVVYTAIQFVIFHPTKTWERTGDAYYIKITRAGVSAVWGGGRTERNLTIGAASQQYPDISGTVRLGVPSGTKLVGFAQENLNGTGWRGGNHTTIYELMTLPSGWNGGGNPGRLHAYGRGWSNGSGRLIGIWFYDEANGYVICRPRTDTHQGTTNVDTLEPGDVLVSRLTLQVVTGDGNARVVHSSATLTVKMSKPSISISWGDGVQGSINKNGPNSAVPLDGTVLLENRPAGGWGGWPIELSAEDRAGSGNPSTVAVENTPFNDQNRVDFNRSLNSNYGTWYWATDDGSFKFVPKINTSQFQAVSPTNSATTTLTAKLRQSNTDFHSVSITVTISSTELPQLTIATTGDSNILTEGTDRTATFVVTSSIAISNLDVKYTPTSVGSDYLDTAVSGIQATEQLTSTDNGGVHSVNIILNLRADNSKDEEDGQVMVQLDFPADTSYTVGSTRSAFYYVKDSTIPVISMDAVHNSVTEGQMEQNQPVGVSFKLTSTTVEANRLKNIDVRYSVDQGGSDFLDPIQAARDTANFPADFESPTFNIRMIDDDVNEPDGKVTITLVAPGTPETGKSAPYSVSSPGNVISVDLIDNDEPPATVVDPPVTGGDNDDQTTTVDDPNTSTVSVNITTSTPRISFGETAYFEIWATPPDAERELTVKLQSLQTVNSVAFRIPRYVNLSGIESGYLVVETLETSDMEAEGKIEITVVANGDDYEPGSLGVAIVSVNSVVVTQSAEPTNQGQDEETKNSVVGSVLSSILEQSTPVDTDETPVISAEYGGLGIEEGESGTFRITSSRAVDENTEINLSVGSTGDYFSPPLPASTTVEIQEGENSTTYQITTVDDGVAGGEPGDVTVTVQTGTGYEVSETQSTATITITDPDYVPPTEAGASLVAANSAILPELMTTIGTRSIEFTRRRMELAMTGGHAEVLAVNGSATIPGMIQSFGNSINNETLSLRSVLGESSFAFDLFPQTGPIESGTIWGLGDLHDVSGNGAHSDSSWQGSTFSGHFGFDIPFDRHLIGGTAVSTTETTVNYAADATETMAFEIRTDSIHPYMSFNSPDNHIRLDVITGYGISRVNVEDDVLGHVELTGDFNYSMVEGSRNFLTINNLPFSGVVDLDVSGEMWQTEQRIEGQTYISGLESTENQVRMALNGIHQMEFDIGSLNTTLSTALRSDSKRQQRTTGVEPSLAIGYESQDGLSVTGAGGTFLMNGLNSIESRLSTSINYDAGSDRYGLVANGNAAWIRSNLLTYGGLWDVESLDNFGISNSNASGVHLDTEIGYGLKVKEFSGIVTPYSGVSIADGSIAKVYFGQRVSVGENVNLNMQFSATNNSGYSDRRFRKSGSINW